MKIPVSSWTTYARANKNILVDSGATDNFINPRLVWRLRLGTHNLERAWNIWNIDGTNNKVGLITDYVDLNIQTGQKQAKMRFLITDLGNKDLILGYPWLANFEPKFSWGDGVIDTSYLPIIIWSLDWETRLNRDTISWTISKPLSEQERVQIVEDLEDECSLKATISNRLTQDAWQYQDKVDILKEYQKHWKVFSEEEAHWFPPSRPWDHAIELAEGAPKAIDCKIIPTTAEEDEVLQKFLKEQLEKGYIWKSKSLYASAFFFIKKKDGKLWPIQDYWKLNEYTIKNKYPLPLIPELITRVKKVNIFSKFDIRWGYNNIQIKEGDEYKVAFKTKYGLYKLGVMFFGLTNSPATFQAMMDHLLQPWANKWEQEGVMGSWYMDDVLIASRNKEAHQQATHELLEIFALNDLYLKPEKCVWEQPSIDYLGLILEEGVTHMDPTKVTGIANWPTPKTVKQVWSFLGFFNFYQPFIYQFSHIAKPLNELTKKDTPWSWGMKQQDTFETLRKQITSEPVLRQPQLDQQFEVEVDMSGYTIGAALMQKDETGKRHPVAYFSSTLSKAKWYYNIYTLKLYAIVRALRHWRPFLAGSPHEVVVHTDHANLQYWKEPQKINQRIAREAVELSEYKIKIKHIPGRENGRADMLSRWSDYDQGENDNQNIVVLSEQLFIQQGMISYIPEEPPQQDEGVICQWAGTHDLKKRNGEWWKGQCKVVTGNNEERHKIIQAYHNLPAYGHPGIRDKLNKGPSIEVLLVAPTQSERARLCQRMHQLSKEQGQHPSKESSPKTHNSDTWSAPIPNNSHGLHSETTWIRRVQFDLNNHRSWLYQDANCDTLQGNNQHQRSSGAIPQTDLPQIQTPIQNHQQSRPQIHIKVHEGTLLTTGDNPKRIHSLPSPNGQAIRMFKSMAGTISPLLGGSSTNQLASLSFACQICSQLMEEWNHKTDALWSPHGVHPKGGNIQCDFFSSHCCIMP